MSKNTGPTPLEVGALVKAQVTKEEEAEDGANDKGKSLRKNRGKDKRRQQGRLRKAESPSQLGSSQGSDGLVLQQLAGESHQLKDFWRSNMEKGQSCCRMNTIDGNMSQSSSGRDQSAETTTCNCSQKGRMEQTSNPSEGRTVE